jgi:cellulose biosynthesis protein BcsQ
MSHQNVFAQGANDLEVLADVLRAAGRIRKEARVLRPSIRRCVRVAEAAGLHLPVTLHDRQSHGAIDYAALADDFLAQLGALK